MGVPAGVGRGVRVGGNAVDCADVGFEVSAAAGSWVGASVGVGLIVEEVSVQATKLAVRLSTVIAVQRPLSNHFIQLDYCISILQTLHRYGLDYTHSLY